MGRPIAKCPIRPGEPCNLCFSGASGPEDCSLVWMVVHDPELSERLAEIRREAHLEEHRKPHPEWANSN